MSVGTLGVALARTSSAATPTVPFWLQIVTIVLAPVLALAGVGFGARLTRSGEEMQWLRNSRLQAYNSFLLACNSYDVAIRRLTESLRSGDRGQQSTSREDALGAIRDVITHQESVLLLGSPRVRAQCEATVTAIYAANDRMQKLISRTSRLDDGSDTGQALRAAVTSFREAVRSDLAPRRARLWPRSKRPDRQGSDPAAARLEPETRQVLGLPVNNAISEDNGPDEIAGA
jgi:hypothetical protein